MTFALAGLLLACALLARVALRRWMIVRVRGVSMVPTLRDGDRVLARRLRPGDEVHRDDIIVFARTGSIAPGDPGLMIKRIAAIAPADRVIVRGDAALSLDSRQLGAIARSQILAVVVHRYHARRHGVAVHNNKEP